MLFKDRSVQNQYPFFSNDLLPRFFPDKLNNASGPATSASDIFSSQLFYLRKKPVLFMFIKICLQIVIMKQAKNTYRFYNSK